MFTIDATRNEPYGRFYNFIGLISGKYGVRKRISRWGILRTGLGTEFQLGHRYFTIRFV